MLDPKPRRLNVALCYITVTGGQRTDEHVERFARTYHQFPPGYEHRTFIVCNGGEPSPVTRFALDSFCGPMKGEFYQRPNDPGWDISAYIEIAKIFGDAPWMLVCMGESIHFHRAGWLARLVEAWNLFGPGMYGAFASNTVRTHINTTGFAISPAMLASYQGPLFFRGQADRYEFEHGERALWRQLADRHIPTMLVTWDGFWHPQAWRVPTNILWRGNQRNCLFFCQHTDRYFASDQKRRRNWERYVDAPFR